MDVSSANSLVVRILAFQASGPGSIPGWRTKFKITKASVAQLVRACGC